MARYWLMKSEPSVFSIDDLARVRETVWDGVRNFQARNFMTTDMKVGDAVLFYHSSCEPPGVAGIAEVSSAAQPDPSQFDRKSEYFEPKATRAKPVWYAVKIRFREKFPRLVPLSELRAQTGLKSMPLLQKGQRLSIQPVEKAQFELIRKLANT